MTDLIKNNDIHHYYCLMLNDKGLRKSKSVQYHKYQITHNYGTHIIIDDPLKTLINCDTADSETDCLNTPKVKTYTDNWIFGTGIYFEIYSDKPLSTEQVESLMRTSILQKITSLNSFLDKKQLKLSN